MGFFVCMFVFFKYINLHLLQTKRGYKNEQKSVYTYNLYHYYYYYTTTRMDHDLNLAKPDTLSCILDF